MADIRWPDEVLRPAPLVSVVVPTCGRAELLMRCLRALLVQTVDSRDLEIIVVDDGPADSTHTLVLALAAEHPQASIRYLRARRDAAPPQAAHGTHGAVPGQGPAVARNAGWRHARGDIVAFTDDDTVPLRDWLANGLAAMRAGGWVALGGRVLVPHDDDPPTDHARMTRGLEATEFVTANAFVRRSALLQVQGFDERFKRAWREDSDLQFRLQDDAGPVGRCEAAIVLHPVRAERWGVSLRQQKNGFFEALLYAKHPQRYRGGAGLPVPWDHYLIVALVLASPLFWLAGVHGSAVVSGLLACALALRFACRRLRGTTHSPEHVAEMLLTSALIPFLSVYWRLRGALHFRVWFL
jgi:glycosyltransferase involved in cell wall biosynthesis